MRDSRSYLIVFFTSRITGVVLTALFGVATTMTTDQRLSSLPQMTKRMMSTMAVKIMYVVHGLRFTHSSLPNVEDAGMSSTHTPATHSISCENTSSCCQMQCEPSQPITSGVSR